jgi:hypothetical protein
MTYELLMLKKEGPEGSGRKTFRIQKVDLAVGSSGFEPTTSAMPAFLIISLIAI